MLERSPWCTKESLTASSPKVCKSPDPGQLHNHETEQLSFASFLIEKEGKWQERADHGDHLNSHGPFLDSYRRMLRVWRELPADEKYELSAENIRQLVAARPYPKG